jgi:hypothetical protein
MKLPVSITTILMLLTLLVGCNESSSPAESKITGVEIDNKTDHVLRDLVVTGLGEPIAFRPVSGGSESRITPTDGRPVHRVRVRWTDPSDQPRSMQIDIKKQFGEGFRGRMKLTLWRTQRMVATAG